MKFKQKLLIVFVLFLLLRVFFLNSYLWYDEAGWGADLVDFNSLKHTPKNIPHMPLSLIFFKASTSIFGDNNFALRIVPLIFGIGLFFMIYLFAKRIYNKETALNACFLFSIGFWPTIATTIVDMDGAILSFFVILTFYFLTYAEKSNFYLFLTGLGLTICTITREITGMILLSIIFIYLGIKWFINKDDIKSYINKFLIILASFIITSIPVLLILYFANPEFYGQLYINTIKLVLPFLSGGESVRSLATFLLSFSVFLWATPLFFYPLFIRKFEKKDLLFYSIIIITFVIFVLSLYGGDPARYFSISLPYLVILVGDWINKVKIHKKSLVILSIAFLMIFLTYNLITPFNPPSNHLDFFNNLKENVLTTIYIYGGSSVNAFYISFISIFMTFLASLILFFKKINPKKIITVFLALNLAFNLFLVIEYNFALTKPNVKFVGNEMIEKIHPYLESKPPIAVDYANYEALEYYFGYEEKEMSILLPFNVFFTTYNAEEISKELEPQIKDRYLYFIDHLKNPKNEIMQMFEEKCELLETSSSKDEVLGYFYRC